MKLEDIFYKGIEIGKKGDPRNNTEINKKLAEIKKEYKKLKAQKKDSFDIDRLKNPYSDSKIFYNNKKEIKKIFVGIDIENEELLLADKLGADTALAHHPEGIALLKLADVMDIHNFSLNKAGIPINITEKLISERQSQLNKRICAVNYNRSVDTAKLLDINFANLHTPADNLANKFMQNRIDSYKNIKLKDIIDMTYELYEYEVAAKQGSIPKIISGDESSQTGKVFVKFNGGTSGNSKIFKFLEMFGISTMVCMHLPEDQLKLAEKYNINVIVMPHMASDSLGMNLLLKDIFKDNKDIEIIAGSGYICNL